MWLLQSDEAFDGRKLWLRPGKTYLFGRTVSEAGQLAISHNTISRKHLTITVDNVQPGHAYNLSSRSGVTIEDLKTKIGTVVNGRKIKGDRYVVDGDEAEITMGKCPSKFVLSWNPVIFTFSFTKKELQTQPLTTLQDRFENLDIKLLTEYSAKYTTHVVSKKRNTAKGLQALINGKYIVTETFLDAVVEAAAAPVGDGSENSALEQDYEASWPDPIKHLPPRGGEPVQHPDETYSPNPERREVFEGYTFIFYDKAQYDNLLAPITNGGGKAFMEIVEGGETEVDDFVNRVKAIAGEQALGDGGKGAVLVRFVPAKGEQIPWYTDFFTAVSLRLDHRPIEQSEFLEAILIKDASILRRPLEVDDSVTTQPPQPDANTRQEPVRSGANSASQDEPQVIQESRSAPRRGRTRTAVKRRFAGFDNDSDIDMDDTPSVPPTESNATPQQEEQGLFMSQEPEASQEPSGPSRGSRSQRKRSPPHADDDMGDIAPAAARFKRQRLEAGDHFASPSPEPSPEPEPVKPPKKIKKELDVLAVAAQNREQEEARARAEKEDLAHLPDDIDLSQIRKLQIVEKMDIRDPSSAVRSQELDIAGGRWNPKWNGMKNFKKFRRRGEVTGRAPARVIISLAEVRNKEFGIGDDYWLENETQRKKTNSQPSGTESQPSAPRVEAPAPRAPRIMMSDSEDEAPEPTDNSSASQRRTRTTQRESGLASQSSRATTQSQGKRPAPEPPKAQPAKRPRQTRKVIEIADSDSDDDLKFRFGKRR